jgi:glycerol-3-phosphate O-acyltransferase
MPRDELLRDLGETRDRAARLEDAGQVHMSRTLRKNDPEQLLESAVAVWDGYHTRSVARQVGPDIVAEDPTLLLYYQNRLLDYAGAIAGEDDLPAAREIALTGAPS